MAKSTQTPAEKRAGLQRQLDEFDLERLKAVQAVFQMPEALAFREALRELHDATDTTALQRSAAADPNALVANALAPFDNVPQIADQLVLNLEGKLNPPATVDPSAQAAPVSPTPPTE